MANEPQEPKEILGITKFLKTKRMIVKLGSGEAKACTYVSFAEMQDFHWVQPVGGESWLKVHENQVTVIL